MRIKKIASSNRAPVKLAPLGSANLNASRINQPSLALAKILACASIVVELASLRLTTNAFRPVKVSLNQLMWRLDVLKPRLAITNDLLKGK